MRSAAVVCRTLDAILEGKQEEEEDNVDTNTRHLLDFHEFMTSIMRDERSSILDFPLALEWRKLRDIPFAIELGIAEKLLELICLGDDEIVAAGFRILADFIMQESCEFLGRVVQARVVVKGESVGIRDMLRKATRPDVFINIPTSMKEAMCHIIGQIHSVFPDDSGQYISFFHYCLYSDSPELLVAAGKTAVFMIKSIPNCAISDEIMLELPFDSSSLVVSCWFFQAVNCRMAHGIIDFNVDNMYNTLGTVVTRFAVMTLAEATKKSVHACAVTVRRVEKLQMVIDAQDASLRKYVALIVYNTCGYDPDAAQALTCFVPVFCLNVFDTADCNTRCVLILASAKIMACVNNFEPDPLDDILDVLALGLQLGDRGVDVEVMSLFYVRGYATDRFLESLLSLPEIDRFTEDLIRITEARLADKK